MTSPAPDTGRTAEETRETIASLIEQVTYWRIRTARAEKNRDDWKGRHSSSITRLDTALVDRDAAEAEAAHLRAENANLRDRVREAEKGAEASRWRRTGTSSHPAGGGRGESQWFRPADGGLRMFPMGFDPNSGTYGPVVMHQGHAVFLCPGDTFVPAPHPLSPEPQEAGDHEPR